MLERKSIPLQRETVCDHEVTPAMGPVELDLPGGRALCHDAVGTTMITACRDPGEKFIAVISVAEFGGRLLGTLSQFSAESARSFAASMIASADEIDGGGVKQ